MAQRSFAELSLSRVGYTSTEMFGHQLVAVAEAKNGLREVEDFWIEGRHVLSKDRSRSSRKDDALGSLKVVCVNRGWKDFGVDSKVPDSLGNQVGVLASKIKNCQKVVIGHLPFLVKQDISSRLVDNR